jgi:hypothetical protein
MDQTITKPKINPDSVLLKKIQIKTVKIEKIVTKNFGVQVADEKKKSTRKKNLVSLLSEERLERKKPIFRNMRTGRRPRSGLGITDNIINFFIFTLFGKLIELSQGFLPKLLGIGNLLKIGSNIIGWFTGFIVNSIVSFIDTGYKVYDNIVGKSKEIKQLPFKQATEGFSVALNDTLSATTDLISIITGQTIDKSSNANNTQKEQKPKGAAVGGPIGTTRGNLPVNKPISRELRTTKRPAKPRKEPVQKPRIGKDAGGEANVRAFYGSPKAGIGGILGLFRPKNAPIRKTPVDSISTISTTLRGRGGLFGDISSVGSDVALGQKPEKAIYRNTAKDVVYLAQIIANKQENKTKESILGMAYGGTVPSSVKTISSQAEMIDLVEAIIKKSVEERVNNALNEMKAPIARRSEEIKKDGIISSLNNSFDGILGLRSYDGTVGSSGTMDDKSTPDYSDIKADTPEERAFIATVRLLEGTSSKDGYNTFFGGSQYGGDLSNKTVSEVVALQHRFLREGKGRFSGGRSAAVGAGQFMEPENIVREMGLDPNKVKFTPELQNQMILHLAKKRRGVDASKPLTERDFRILGGEWASFTPQYGQTSRTAGQSLDVYNRLLQNARLNAREFDKNRREEKFKAKGGSKPSDFITSSYGMRRHPVFGTMREHKGMDFAGGGFSFNSPISVIKPGTVVDINDSDPHGAGYGYFVVVKHDDGTHSFYAHLNRVNVRKGQKLNMSSGSYAPVIGTVGSTGVGTGPHLHFELGTGWNGGTLEGRFNPKNYVDQYLRAGGEVKIEELISSQNKLAKKNGIEGYIKPNGEFVQKKWDATERKRLNTQKQLKINGKPNNDTSLNILDVVSSPARARTTSNKTNKERRPNKRSVSRTKTNPARQQKPQRSWYDPRGWFGKKGGGIIGQTPYIPSGYASYENYGGLSVLAIQPMIINQAVPIPESNPIPIPFPVASGVNNISNYRA